MALSITNRVLPATLALCVVSNNPTVNVQMLIRRPVEEVFAAFIDPDVTSKFWFSRGTSKLENDAQVTWYWDWYNVSAELRVLRLVENRAIEIEWGEDSQKVLWEFEEVLDGTMTAISITGFSGSDNEVLAQAIDSKGGFSLVLAGAKAYLEHGIELQLVPDQNPMEGS